MGMTKKQQSIYDYIMKNREEVCYLSLKELSEKTNASEVSVLNVCRLMGFSGFLELKIEFRKKRSTLKQLEKIDVKTLTDENQLYDFVTSMEVANLQALFSENPKENLKRCAELILAAKKVVVLGHEVSALPAKYLAHRLNYLRIRAEAFQISEKKSVKIPLMKLKENDCAVFFSFPPYYMPIKKAVLSVKNQGGQVIVITNSMESPAAITGSTVLLCPTDTRYFFNSLTGPIALVGLITTYLAALLGEEIEEILKEEQKGL